MLLALRCELDQEAGVVRVRWPDGITGPAVLEGSTDLDAWETMQEITPMEAAGIQEVPIADERLQFFRVRPLPEATSVQPK